MPYMFCNHEGCNETVKLPAQYCYKHTPFEQEIKASDLTVTVDTGKIAHEVLKEKGLLDIIEPESVKPLQDTTHLDLLDKANKSMNTKKTTK